MSARLEKLFRRTPGQRRTAFALMLAGIIVVPLAIAGLVSGALASADDRLDAVPAIVVNNDEMVTATLPDGSEQMILAGRQLVTELTGPDTAGFAWTISNSEHAAAALAAGEAYAVLTIPSDFSAAINSLSGAEPTQADLQITTDDAHAYLAGSAAQSVGEAMTSSFGRAITTQYLTAFYSGIAEMGSSLGTAADGATTLSSGVGTLAGGLDTLSTGAGTAASGAAELADGASGLAGGASGLAGGVREYSTGVDGIAAGLGTLNSSAAGLTQLSDGVKAYTQGINGAVGQLNPYLDQGMAALGALMPSLTPEQQQAAQGALQAMGGVQAGINQLVGSGDELAAQTATAIGGVQGGIGQLADGAAQLSGGSDGLRSGADSLAGGASELAGGASELAGGIAQLADGAGASASGAHQLHDGASELATGLGDGAEQASALAGSDPQTTAEVIAEPVGVSLERENAISSIGQIIGMVFVPVGLWIGALVIFLLMRPVTALALGSTASTGRIVARGLLRGFAIAAAQALVVVALLHTALGVSWAALPATLGFSLLMAAAFVAVHHFLVTAWGRTGIVVSLVLLALQLTSAGGLYPVEILAAPFQLISPILPLTWAVQGMQAIVAGVGGGAVGTAALVLAVFALLGALGSLAVVARRRGARSFAFALAQS
ncbi:YhgE/Pip family protein [Microterricola pindariensis]|uniref:YhgE/Pip domain-containing protein n=1 Tax=Microterricola pindariensis TaxID=478010 RepID=A0ABX5AX56_9MICO|nr:YhgE/Pip family protein [Microterricola pindariensis]PPL18964.1 hypothetical protein GY24_08345 [Microterricola pindariensis]